MPRCFMTKKLKYPYEQWKLEQGKAVSSRSPSPVEAMEHEQQHHSTAVEYRDVQPAHQATPTHPFLFTNPYASLLGVYPHSPFTPTANPFIAHQPLPAHRASSLTPPPEASRGDCGPTDLRKSKDIFRPYCLDDPTPIATPTLPTAFHRFYPSPPLQYRDIEDINTAHAILDLSRKPTVKEEPISVVDDDEEEDHVESNHKDEKSTSENQDHLVRTSSSSSSPTPTPLLSPALSTSSASTNANSDQSQTFKINNGKTTAYTYEAFFASDGRSKKRNNNNNISNGNNNGNGQTEVGTKTRYTCSECGKNYATSSNLSRHKQTHRSLDSNNAKKCHVCGKMYVSMPALSMHILTHNLSHKCNVCGKAFSRPWLLQGHMRSHSGDKPYGCAHCGKSFADRSNLRAHMQTHSAFKNFKCKRCHKSFALKSYLNKHYESACFKDQPLPSIDTPPMTPAPSELSDGLVSPGSTASSTSSSTSHTADHSPSSSSISSLLTVMPQTHMVKV